MSPNVLVVDDSLTVRMDLQEAFEAAGIPATACATLAAARRALAEAAFGLVVMDVQLPDGNGVDFLEELRSEAATAKVPVLLLSTEAEVGDRVRGVRGGADDYVGKPYDRTFLLARAQELLRPKEEGTRETPLILVVDDSLSFREGLRAGLEAEGYSVLLAANGEEGLSLAAASRPDALLVDAGLPGIDGLTLVRRVRMDVALSRTPCLLLTASEGPGCEVKALEAGADTFIQKTEDIAILLGHLGVMLRGVETGRAFGKVPSLFGPKRILAVDDSNTFLQERADQVRQDGYDVILASSGSQALEVLEVQEVDCILLDLVMPGLSGEETCRRIKASPTWRDLPLVMLTAREDRDTMLQAFNVGADDYIPKSSDFEVIKARVRAQIRRKHFEDENRRIREELIQKEREALEARAARELAQARAVLLTALENANRELEAFSYSVSHDLQSPLRAIDGFSTILMKEYAHSLDDKGVGYLKRVKEGVQRMAQLVEALLRLSQISRAELNLGPVDLSGLVQSIAGDLQHGQPEREVTFRIQEGLQAEGDGPLIRAALENLLRNAWKYSGKRPHATIEFGSKPGEAVPTYFVKDDGAGFSMAQAAKLFAPFQRLHARSDFEGTGIGLATVLRIIRRHGGRIWAEAEVDVGATFYFTLQPVPVG